MIVKIAFDVERALVLGSVFDPSNGKTFSLQSISLTPETTKEDIERLKKTCQQMFEEEQVLEAQKQSEMAAILDLASTLTGQVNLEESLEDVKNKVLPEKEEEVEEPTEEIINPN